MLIKRFCIGSAVIVCVVFFSYVGYVDLVYDAAAGAEARIEAQFAQQMTTQAGTATSAPVNPGVLRAKIALGEYRKGVKESSPGCNCGPEVDKYTGGKSAQWCAMFASWVSREAGAPVQNKATGSWRIENSKQLATYLRENGTWVSKDEAISRGIQPQIGDFIVFSRGDFEGRLGHVDIVVDVTIKGAASVVGGNKDNAVRYTKDFAYENHYGFLGFGRPEK